jgi:hypothetical protein
MWYVEGLPKTYNEGDRPFYDAIKFLPKFYEVLIVINILSLYFKVCIKYIITTPDS